MRTTSLGSTNISVSQLCLGAMYFGTRNDEAASFRLLDTYTEAGGCFIDTANIYSHWEPGFKGYESECLLGRWMKARKNRSNLVIATKVGFEIPKYGVERGLPAGTIRQECEKSLRNLGVETIDLYYAHCDDPHTPLEETLGAFEQLVQAGKVRTIGASNYQAWRLEEARWVSKTHGWSEFCCVQQRHTYLQPRPGQSFFPQVAVNDDLREYCRRRPVTLLAYAALLAGAYTRADREFPRQFRGLHAEPRLSALRTLAVEKKVSVNQIVLAWMLNSNPFVLPLIAASSEAQLKENIQALEIFLSPDEMKFLDEAGC